MTFKHAAVFVLSVLAVIVGVNFYKSKGLPGSAWL